jgi:hypothetical protein
MRHRRSLQQAPNSNAQRSVRRRRPLLARAWLALGHVIKRVHCAVSVYCWNATILSP